MGSYKKLLLNTIGILTLAVTVATMGSDGRVAQAENIFDPVRPGGFPASAPFGPGIETSTAFHFLQPIAVPSGDPSKFDPDLLNYLTVDICALTTNGCDPVAKFTSPQIRITSTGGYGSFYIVNWDTSKASFNSKRTYRVSVLLIDTVLGSVDLTPTMYSSFGRTWPIKFMIEKDPKLRILASASAGKNLWQVADDLRTELGICGDPLKQLLLDNYPNADLEQVTEVVNGVCQEVELFPTTKIADKATRDALAFYDTSTGQMVFAGDTNLLKNLKVNDVLVSREGPSAPYGYLRKVTSIRKSRGFYTLQTVQAKFTEAIKRATLQTSGPLEPADADQSQGFASEGRSAEFDVGKSIPFSRHIDVTIDLNGGDDELGGSGTINVVGDVEIQAGYNIGAGIELCKTPPFACADRVEAWMGFIQKSSLHVTGKFDGHLHKEFKYPIEMSPIFFMIGPIPVWLVPEVNVIVGLDGTAHVDFEFNAAAQSTVKPYIKWTEDDGWKDLTAFAPLSNSFLNAKFAGNAELEGYAKLDAALLLYGVIGPSMDGSLGIVGEAKTNESPFWKISGHVKAGIGLRSVFSELFDIDAHEDFLDETFLIKAADKLPPEFSNVRSGAIPVDVGKPVYLGPRTSPTSLQGYYEVRDPDGPSIPNVVATSADGQNIGLNPTFSTPGLRNIKITATDSDNLSSSISLAIDVRNSAPILTVTPSALEVGASEQLFITARAYDPEDGFLPCSRLTWTVTSPDTKTVKSSNLSCAAAIVFNVQGPRNVEVSAKDSFGTTFTRSVTINVGPPPSNRKPVIDLDSFKIFAATGHRSSNCVTGISCEVPDDSLLYNGANDVIGDYHAPLTMQMDVSDPEGDPFIVHWFCQTGDQFAPIIYDGEGFPTCEPLYSATQPIYVYASISLPGGLGSDGEIVLGYSPIYQFSMLQIVR